MANRNRRMSGAVPALGLSLALSLSGCGDEQVNPGAPPEPVITESDFDRQVREVCEAVAAAADSFYSAEGQYPIYMGEFKPYLPGGRLLVNPATGEANLPYLPQGLIEEPFEPGTVAMRIFRYNDGWTGTHDIGYSIVGRRELCDYVITNVTAQELARDRDRAVIENCRTVAVAAEAFAADNDGVYATNNGDVSNAGLTIQQYLPAGLLENPYTGMRTEPLWGAAAAASGQTGYLAVDPDGDGVNDGYHIDGVGATSGTTIWVYSMQSDDPWPEAVVIAPCPGTGVPPPPDMPFDERVLANCDLVAAAALAYFDDSGAYAAEPRDLIAYLPSGRGLLNPATGAHSEPSRRMPDDPGTIGYRLIWEYEAGPLGYFVQGEGEYDRFSTTNVPDIGRHLELEARVIENCILTSEAAEAFAADNDGVYPVDHLVVNKAGRTMRQYLPGGNLLVNPYTQRRSEPHWGVNARTPGEIGYRGWTGSYHVSGMNAQPGYRFFWVSSRNHR